MAKPTHRLRISLLSVATAATLLAGCTPSSSGSGGIIISGSSTVAPITQAVALDGNVQIDLAEEGTTAGFERFCTGESHINNASTAIPGAGQPVDYVQLCEDNGVEFIELPIALDALSIVRHIDNDFVTDLTRDELRSIWEPDSEVVTWSDVRPDWPDEQIELAGRPSGSGTFDYFTHHVNGEVGAIRDDYRTTNDLGEPATWIAEDANALGFMGVGNYLAADETSRDVITTVAVNGIEPSLMNAQGGTYSPFTRPLFIYVSLSALDTQDGLTEFVEHYLEVAYDILPRVYFYRLPHEAYDLVTERFASRTTGSLLDGDPYADASIVDLLSGS